MLYTVCSVQFLEGSTNHFCSGSYTSCMAYIFLNSRAFASTASQLSLSFESFVLPLLYASSATLVSSYASASNSLSVMWPFLRDPMLEYPTDAVVNLEA